MTRRQPLSEPTAERRDLHEILEIAEARLADATPDLPLTFSFRWQGMRHDCKAVMQGEGAELTLVSTVRAMPYTAEDGAARKALTALVHPSLRLAEGRFALSAQQRVVYAAKTLLEPPVTNGGLIAETIRLLFKARASLLVAQDPALIGDLI